MTSEVTIEVDATGPAPSAEFRERITKAVTDVVAERLRQETKWGEQNHPMILPPPAWGYDSPHVEAERLNLPSARTARDACEWAHRSNRGTYTHILVEEVAEFVEACVLHGETSDEARAEMVQVAAVALAMLEAIDRKRAKVTP